MMETLGMARVGDGFPPSAAGYRTFSVNTTVPSKRIAPVAVKKNVNSEIVYV